MSYPLIRLVITFSEYHTKTKHDTINNESRSKVPSFSNNSHFSLGPSHALLLTFKYCNFTVNSCLSTLKDEGIARIKGTLLGNKINFKTQPLGLFL